MCKISERLHVERLQGWVPEIEQIKSVKLQRSSIKGGRPSVEGRTETLQPTRLLILNSLRRRFFALSSRRLSCSK